MIKFTPYVPGHVRAVVSHHPHHGLQVIDIGNANIELFPRRLLEASNEPNVATDSVMVTCFLPCAVMELQSLTMHLFNFRKLLMLLCSLGYDFDFVLVKWRCLRLNYP